MKILIVEDDPLVADDIQDKLEHLGFQITAIANSYESAIEAIELNPPDLALLDIQLRGVNTGIDVGKRLAQLGIPHMYLSDVQDQANFMLARETGPLRNIPKPLTKTSLRNALDIDILQVNSKNPSVIRMFPDGDKRKKINLNDIIYIKADGSYCHVFTNQDKFTLSMNIKNCLQKIDWPDIIRTARSFAINVNHVDFTSGNQIQMINGALVYIERQYKSTVEKRLKNL